MPTDQAAVEHPPIVTRHHILIQLECLSRNYTEVLAFREFLGAGPTSDELLQWLLEHGVMDEKLRESVRRKWGPAEGWLGDIHAYGVGKFKEAFDLVGEHGPYLSAQLLIGYPKFRIIVRPSAEVIHMLAMCPRLPEVIVRNRVVNDPTFRGHLTSARDSIQALLDMF